MTERFDKDQWILRALACRYLVTKVDGSCWRLHKTIWLPPENTPQRVYKRIAISIHKKTQRRYFNMTFEGITKSVLVNRAVALQHIPNPLGLPEVNHIDGEKGHNWKANLEWANRSEQEKHAFRTGLKSIRGSANGNAKLNADKVAEIRESNESDATLAITFDVSRKTIEDVRTRRTWSHV